MHLYKRPVLGNASIIGTATGQLMLPEELGHREVLLVAPVNWKPEAQEAGSVSSQLIACGGGEPGLLF